MARPIRSVRPAVFLALLLFFGAVSGTDQAATGAESRLENFYGSWIEGLRGHMLEEEHRAFLALGEDRHRELFLRRFWEARDPDPRQPGNLPLELWRHNELAARDRFGDLDDPRSQAMILTGAPTAITVFGGCSDVIRPLEIWSFGAWHPGAAKNGYLYLVFYRRGSRTIHWTPAAEASELLIGEQPWAVDRLVNFTEARGCLASRFGPSVNLLKALSKALGPEALRRELLAQPPDPSWLETFAADLHSGRALLPAAYLDLSVAGAYQKKAILEGQVHLPVAEIERNADGDLVDRIEIVGDAWLGRKGGRLVDSFEIVHYIAGPEQGSATIALPFYRRLRPGTYLLDLRVADSRGLALWRGQKTIEVSLPANEAREPAGFSGGFAGLTRSQVGVLTTFPSVELLPFDDGMLIGEVILEARTTGGPIARVELYCDGQRVSNDLEPPWAAELTFEGPPTDHSFQAIAYDPDGRELDRDEKQTVAAPGRLAVRILEPVPGSAATRVRASVDLPVDQVLDRLDLFLGQEHLATLHQPPFLFDLPPRHRSGSTEPVFVRAVATTTSGESAEDLVIIDTRAPFEEIDVELVQLFTSVVDASGRPMKHLASDRFRVLEDDVEQPLVRFDTVENLAINVGLLMDVSSSMRRRIDTASRSARKFFQTVLTEKDTASLLTFNHDIRRVVPFTGDVDRLLLSASGFRAWGTTRLYDSLVFAVYSFGGLEGKRALILLSDGQDVDSDFPFPQVREGTLRSGVAVYPIVLGVEDLITLQNLETLARDTGGRFFTIRSVDQLDRVYRSIEEDLRSQYLLVYRSPAKTQRHELRTVRVEMSDPSWKARTLHGYYPQ